MQTGVPSEKLILVVDLDQMLNLKLIRTAGGATTQMKNNPRVENKCL